MSRALVDSMAYSLNLSGMSDRAFNAYLGSLKGLISKQDFAMVQADREFSIAVKKAAAQYERGRAYISLSAADVEAIAEVLSFAVQLVHGFDESGNAPIDNKARRFIYRGTPYFLRRIKASGSVMVFRNPAALPFASSGLGGALDFQGCAK